MSEKKDTNVEPVTEDMREQYAHSYKSNKERPRLIPKTSEIERGGAHDLGFGQGRR